MVQASAPEATAYTGEGDTLAAPEVLVATFAANRDARCPRCRHNVRGLAGTSCPECGLPLELALATPNRLVGRRGLLALAFVWMLVIGGVHAHLARQDMSRMSRFAQTIITTARPITPAGGLGPSVDISTVQPLISGPLTTTPSTARITGGATITTDPAGPVTVTANTITISPNATLTFGPAPIGFRGWANLIAPSIVGVMGLIGLLLILWWWRRPAGATAARALGVLAWTGSVVGLAWVVFRAVG